MSFKIELKFAVVNAELVFNPVIIPWLDANEVVGFVDRLWFVLIIDEETVVFNSFDKVATPKVGSVIKALFVDVLNIEILFNWVVESDECVSKPTETIWLVVFVEELVSSPFDIVETSELVSNDTIVDKYSIVEVVVNVELIFDTYETKDAFESVDNLW